MLGTWCCVRVGVDGMMEQTAKKRVLGPCGLWVIPDQSDGFVHLGTVTIPDGMALLAWHVAEECPERARLN